MKKNMIKVLLLAFVVLGLTACNDTVENQDSPTESNNSQTTEAEQGVGGTSSESTQRDLSVFDDFPEWWQDRFTEAEKEILLDALTPEELEQLREQAEEWGEEGPPRNEGAQRIFTGPEGIEPNEDGLIIFD